MKILVTFLSFFLFVSLVEAQPSNAYTELKKIDSLARSASDISGLSKSEGKKIFSLMDSSGTLSEWVQIRKIHNLRLYEASDSKDKDIKAAFEYESTEIKELIKALQDRLKNIGYSELP